MRKFKIGDIVIFNKNADLVNFELLDLTFNKDYIIFQVISNTIYSIINDVGSIQNVSESFLSLSPIYKRNEIINDILN